MTIFNIHGEHPPDEKNAINRQKSYLNLKLVFGNTGHLPAERPLSDEQLRGKVTLVYFWTYSCINCIRTLPYLRAWADKYKDQGLTVIGVHTPEFAFEKRPENVRRAIPDFRIGFPVAVDSDYDKEGRPIIDPQNSKKAPDQGAATSFWCATNPRLDGMGGVYCADCDIARALPPDDSRELHGVRTRATDPIAAGRLWQLSEQLTGASID